MPRHRDQHDFRVDNGVILRFDTEQRLRRMVNYNATSPLSSIWRYPPSLIDCSIALRCSNRVDLHRLEAKQDTF